MDWPTAIVLIVLISGLALVFVAALRFLGQALDRRLANRKQRSELITEVTEALRKEVKKMRSELELPEK